MAAPPKTVLSKATDLLVIAANQAKEFIFVHTRVVLFAEPTLLIITDAVLVGVIAP
jgi:hypothetical protein